MRLCASADYGHISTIVEVPDPLSPNGKHPAIVTPKRIRQSDTMELFDKLQVFVDEIRTEYGLPTSTET